MAVNLTRNACSECPIYTRNFQYIHTKSNKSSQKSVFFLLMTWFNLKAVNQICFKDVQHKSTKITTETNHNARKIADLL